MATHNPSPMHHGAARRLGFEQLEDRHVLAPFTVTNPNDAFVDSAGDAPGTLRQAVFDANALAGTDTIDFTLSLPATITLTQGELEITDSVHIIGPGSEMLTIAAFDPTVDPFDGVRIFRIQSATATPLEVEISGLTLTGGDPSASFGAAGGAIFSTEELTVRESIITGNQAQLGGGIYMQAGEELYIVDSELSNNRALGSGAGGAIFIYGNSGTTLTVLRSTISGNQAESSGGGVAVNIGGDSKPTDAAIIDSVISDNEAGIIRNGTTSEFAGGGISFNQRYSTLQVLRSTISGNTVRKVVPIDGGSATQPGGGGVYSNAALTLITDSTISGNDALGVGGGLDQRYGEAVIENSTISGNRATSGGGIFCAEGFVLRHSTITGNTSGYLPPDAAFTPPPPTSSHRGYSVGGGGILVSVSAVGNTYGTTIEHSIISGNVHLTGDGHLDTSPFDEDDNDYAYLIPGKPGSPDVGTFFLTHDPGTVPVNYTIVGTTGGSINDGDLAFTGAGNQFNVVQPLGPPADNGGPTFTHLPAAASPAIDAGDPAITMGGVGTVPEYDQRGPSWVRVFDDPSVAGNAIDIGAVERQPDPVPCPPGDYNDDNIVDAADYVVWRKFLGTMFQLPNEAASPGVVDQDDYPVWRENFGEICEAEATAEIAVLPGGARVAFFETATRDEPPVPTNRRRPADLANAPLQASGDKGLNLAVAETLASRSRAHSQADALLRPLERDDEARRPKSIDELFRQLGNGVVRVLW